MIPFYKTAINRIRALSLINQALSKGWLTTGPLTHRFENELMNFLEADNFVSVASATQGLTIAARCLDVKPKDIWFIPTNTFISTYTSLSHLDADIRLVDIEMESFNMDLVHLRRLLIDAKEKKEEPKGVIFVPFAGAPAKMDYLHEICLEFKLKCILDSAHALETRFEGLPLHKYADASVYSFYATKNLTTAEGGGIVFKNQELAERALFLRLHGLSRQAWDRYEGGKANYDIKEMGDKANLSDIHAAIGLAQTRNLKKRLQQRKKKFAYYLKKLNQIPYLSTQKYYGDHACHLMVVHLSFGRDELLNSFLKNKIRVSIHFKPIYDFSFLSNKYNPKSFQNSEYYKKGNLSLPFWPEMSLKKIDKVSSFLEARILQNMT